MATNRIETLDPALIRPGIASRMVSINFYYFLRLLVLLRFPSKIHKSRSCPLRNLCCCIFVLLPTGRIDRKIEFPLPDEKTKRRIFTIHTGRMTLAEDVNLEEYVMAKDDLSGADIKVQYEKPEDF